MKRLGSAALLLFLQLTLASILNAQTTESLQPYSGTFCSLFGYFDGQQIDKGYNCATIQTINENGDVDGTLSFHILAGPDGTGAFQNGSIVKSDLLSQIVFAASNFTGTLSAYAPVTCTFATQQNCMSAALTGNFSGVYPDGITFSGSVIATIETWHLTGRFPKVSKTQVQNGTLTYTPDSSAVRPNAERRDARTL